jgi:hypothetical protein
MTVATIDWRPLPNYSRVYWGRMPDERPDRATLLLAEPEGAWMKVPLAAIYNAAELARAVTRLRRIAARSDARPSRRPDRKAIRCAAEHAARVAVADLALEVGYREALAASLARVATEFIAEHDLADKEAAT